MSPEDDRDGGTGAARAPRRRRHGCEWLRRFIEEHAARILRASTATEARDWANDHPSTPAASPMLGDAFGHALRGTIATVTAVKGTEARRLAAGSGDVKGTAVRKPPVCRGVQRVEPIPPTRIRCIGCAPCAPETGAGTLHR